METNKPEEVNTDNSVSVPSTLMKDLDAIKISSQPPEPNPENIVISDDERSNEPKNPDNAGIKLNINNLPETTTNINMDEPITEIINLVDRPESRKCINPNCKVQTSEYILAPDFCLSNFRIKKSSMNKEEICIDCYYNAVADNDKLIGKLIEGGLFFDSEMPLINETLQIDDSDEEDGDDAAKPEYINEENIKFISENIDDVIAKTFAEFNITSRMEKEREYLSERSLKVEKTLDEIDRHIQTARDLLDKNQKDVYNQFRPDISNLPAIQIIDDYTLNPSIQIRSESGVRKYGKKNQTDNKISDENIPQTVKPTDLPISKILDKPAPQVEQIYYIAKEKSHGSWIKARLQQIIAAKTIYNEKFYETTHYRLVELKQQKERIISGKLIAYMNWCKSILTVGTRVLSEFKEFNASIEKLPRSKPYYAGIVGEHPIESNKFRYLIFFDIGYAQYVNHNGVNLIYEASINVWDDMPTDSRSFIRKYLQSQDRPMVKLSPNQTVKVEYDGKWWLSTVKNVDCSLVQVYFNQIGRWEWIYRGSTRLSPMFREELAATNRHGVVRNPRKLAANESATVVQYTKNKDFVQQSTNLKENISPSPRAVARKSTTKPNATSASTLSPISAIPIAPTQSSQSSSQSSSSSANPNPSSSSGPTSKIMYFTPRDQQVINRQYKPHKCSNSCRIYLTHNFAKLQGHNPLSKPLLCGWSRLTLKERGKKLIAYKAPCGRTLRNISEVHQYLRVTNSEMTVDLFDFNNMVRCLAEFSVDCLPDPKDLSNGIEQVAIPVIDGVSNVKMDFRNYSIERIPTEGVYMNLDENFLCGCDCVDDCVDKLKCSCWKLTLEGLKYLGKDVDPISVGYIYRRLQEQVITGIYECNSRCKCAATCLNRVAQNPMSLKLQVFKTPNRGWGIRCLNDVPQGTFLCIYAGTLHTEQIANQDGVQYGDEYFAELDYIEIVEKYKEDYEAEVVEDGDDCDRKSLSPVEDTGGRSTRNSTKRRYQDDFDFTTKFTANSGAKSGSATADGIRSRLRRRNKEDEDAEQKKIVTAIGDAKLEGNKSSIELLSNDLDTVTISDDDDDGREVLSFNPTAKNVDETGLKHPSIRELFGPEEKDNVYIMDAKLAGNIGRFLNHSCSPNVFVQNVFVDTHDVRFPWVAFFSSQFIRAGTELTWNYNYDIGSVPGRVLYCHCAALECKGRLL